MAPHSSALAWRTPWMEEPGRLQSMGSLRVGHDWVTSLSRIGEGNGSPLQCSRLENPRDGEAWWAAIYGVAQSQTPLMRLSSSSSSSSSCIALYCRQILYHWATREHYFEDTKCRWLFSSVQVSRSIMSDCFRPHESQHARPPCSSPTPGIHPNSRPSSRWCHPAISSSVIPFSSCPQSLPASESFPMSQLFAWGGQNTGVSALASVLPKNSQDQPC